MPRVTIAPVAATLMAVLVSGTSAAAPAPALDQTMPSVAFNSHPSVRNFLVVWVEDRGARPDLYAKRLFENGLPQGGPTKNGWQVIRDTSTVDRGAPPPRPRSDPSLIYNPTREEFLLTFAEDTGEVDGWDIFSVRISSAGFSSGKPRLVAGGPGDQRRPDTALVEGDEYFVVWDDNARDRDEIWARRLQANSIPRGSAYRLVAEPQWNASDPTTNGSVVAWVDDRLVQTDIWAQRLKNGIINGEEYLVAREVEDEFAPRYGSGGLLWNIYNTASGLDIVGAQVYENDRTRGKTGILVPAADQAWPDAENGIVVFADDRAGELNVYGIRITGNIRVRGREFPIFTDYALP